MVRAPDAVPEGPGFKPQSGHLFSWQFLTLLEWKITKNGSAGTQVLSENGQPCSSLEPGVEVGRCLALTLVAQKLWGSNLFTTNWTLNLWRGLVLGLGRTLDQTMSSDCSVRKGLGSNQGSEPNCSSTSPTHNVNIFAASLELRPAYWCWVGE